MRLSSTSVTPRCVSRGPVENVGGFQDFLQQLQAWSTKIDYGTLPAWLGGFGAILALIWARRAARAAQVTSEQQGTALQQVQSEQLERQAAAERAQASRVAAWWGENSDNAGPYVTNKSDMPVYAVQIVVRGLKGSRIYSLPLLAPYPAATCLQELDDASRVSSYDNTTPTGPIMGTTVEFTDSNGVAWKRLEDGTLERR